jgi:hypothetical protein
LPRKPLSFAHDAKGRAIGVWTLLALAALLAFWPSAEFGIAAGGAGLALTCDAPQQGADIKFMSTVRAFHSQQSNPSVSYVSKSKSK